LKIKGVGLVAVWAGTTVAGIALGHILTGCLPADWQGPPRPLQSGVQQPDPPLQSGRVERSTAVSDGQRGCFVAGVELAPECLEQAPRCPYEDGSPTGWPCLWVDPGTGRVSYVDSSEYWD
jgi:hypothetical protein